MSVLEDIWIDRSRGIVVCDGRDGVHPVREKLSGWYRVDENRKPRRPSRNGKEWGNIELFDRLNNDMLDRLKLFYNVEDSTCLYVRTMLRASYKGITNHLMADNIWKLMVNYS